MNTPILLIVSAVFGLAVGSFLNVLIVRLPAGVRPGGRSRCPKCSSPIRWRHNIPLLSFLWLGGRCAACRRPISWQYPAVEAATAVLFVLVVWKRLGTMGLGGDGQALIYNSLFIIRDWFFVAVLLVVFLIDLKHYLILDVVTLPAAGVALAANLLLGVPWLALAVGAILGAGFFGLQYVISRGRWIGDGDIRLGLLLGVMLGWPNAAVALLLAYGCGAVVGVALLAAGKKQLGSQLPLGTFLALGGTVTLLYGERITRWYLRLASGIFPLK